MGLESKTDTGCLWKKWTVVIVKSASFYLSGKSAHPSSASLVPSASLNWSPCSQPWFDWRDENSCREWLSDIYIKWLDEYWRHWKSRGGPGLGRVVSEVRTSILFILSLCWVWRAFGTSKERPLAQERDWAGATKFGWPQWALEIVKWS